MFCLISLVTQNGRMKLVPRAVISPMSIASLSDPETSVPHLVLSFLFVCLFPFISSVASLCVYTWAIFAPGFLFSSVFTKGNIYNKPVSRCQVHVSGVFICPLKAIFFYLILGRMIKNTEQKLDGGKSDNGKPPRSREQHFLNLIVLKSYKQENIT